MYFIISYSIANVIKKNKLVFALEIIPCPFVLFARKLSNIMYTHTNHHKFNIV